MRSPTIAAVAVVMIASAAAASPDDLVGRDVVLARGAGEFAAALELNLSTRHVYKPVSLAPDLWFGITDALTVGVIHSARATGVLDTGDGLCPRDSVHGCPRAYDNVGVDARYRLHTGAIAIAARLRVVASTFDPVKPSIRPGALVRLHRGRFAVIADPHLELGLANRDQGNRDWLRIPVWLAIQPARRVAIALRTGIDGEFATYADTFAVPLGVDVTIRATRDVDLTGLVAFPELLGPQNQINPRLAWVGVTWRWR